MPRKEPKGLKNLYDAAIDSGESILGMGKTAKRTIILVVSITAILAIAVVGTMCWGVGSGTVKVQEIADAAGSVGGTAAKAAML